MLIILPTDFFDLSTINWWLVGAGLVVGIVIDMVRFPHKYSNKK